MQFFFSFNSFSAVDWLLFLLINHCRRKIVMRLFIAISLKLGGLAEEFVRSFDIVPSREINACLKILLFSSPNFFLFLCVCVPCVLYRI